MYGLIRPDIAHTRPGPRITTIMRQERQLMPITSSLHASLHSSAQHRDIRGKSALMLFIVHLYSLKVHLANMQKNRISSKHPFYSKYYQLKKKILMKQTSVQLWTCYRFEDWTCNITRRGKDSRIWDLNSFDSHPNSLPTTKLHFSMSLWLFRAFLSRIAKKIQCTLKVNRHCALSLICIN